MPPPPPPPPPPSPHVLFVAGTVSLDYLIYPMTASRSPARARHDAHATGSKMTVRTGGAGLVAQLLDAAAPEWDVQVQGPSSTQAFASGSLHKATISMIDLDVAPTNSSARGSFNVVKNRFLIGDTSCQVPASAGKDSASSSSTVVITGSGSDNDDVEPVIDFLQRVKPRRIVHYMTRSLAKGRLWDCIRNGPLTSDGVPLPDNLVVVVDADDLRAEGIPLSRGLSWESTGEDFVRNLGLNGRLDTLATCPNLVVRFGVEGVIHHQGRDADLPTLYFDPRHLEGHNDSGPSNYEPGVRAAFLAGLALGFVDTKADMGHSIRLGIAASQRFAGSNFTLNATDNAPDYPAKQTMEHLTPDRRFTAVQLPSTRISIGDKWSIFDNLTGDPAEVARTVVLKGPSAALAQCPLQRFGDMLSIDRHEHESYRAVLETVEEHLRSSRTTPTCIGFRGSSGAGKKYVSSHLALDLSRKRKVKRVSHDTRNLQRSDLVTICHAIRDNTAQGDLTVATFENFDSVLEDNPALLHDFQNMMHDGTFTDNGQKRPMGHAVLFFLINMDSAISDTTPTPTRTDFREIKIFDDSPVSDYLHGVVQVKGPNCAGVDDPLFAVRRAIMLRHLLERRHPHLIVDGEIDMDDAVLHALLLVPSYKNGLRSLEKIIDTSRLSGRSKFDVTALPPEEQIQLHVDGRIFMSYLRAPRLPATLRERLAHGLFEAYKKQREHMARTEAEKRALESDPAMCDWEDLSGELKESTRAQADDIPRKLRAVGCFMLNEKREHPLVHVPQFSDSELLMLSEMEHERFNAERLQRQWRMGKRNSKVRTTPFLVPWRDLTQDWKDVDRVMVECVPGILNKFGYYIYRMKEDN